MVLLVFATLQKFQHGVRLKQLTLKLVHHAEDFCRKNC